jgi:hypothetical protein
MKPMTRLAAVQAPTVIAPRSTLGLKKEQVFFSEEKKQKTFAMLSRPGRAARAKG